MRGHGARQTNWRLQDINAQCLYRELSLLHSTATFWNSFSFCPDDTMAADIRGVWWAFGRPRLRGRTRLLLLSFYGDADVMAGLYIPACWCAGRRAWTTLALCCVGTRLKRRGGTRDGTACGCLAIWILRTSCLCSSPRSCRPSHFASRTFCHGHVYGNKFLNGFASSIYDLYIAAVRNDDFAISWFIMYVTTPAGSHPAFLLATYSSGCHHYIPAFTAIT